MKSFIVNLPKDIERRQQIEQQCQKLGLEYEIINAVDGRLLTQSELEQKTKPIFRDWLLPGEIGCSLSHLSIYKKMIDSNIEIALVLEDDALISDDIKIVLSYLELHNDISKANVFLLNQVHRVIENNNIRINNKYVIYQFIAGFQTHGYVINLAAAKKMYKFMFPVWLAADEWQYLADNHIVSLNVVCPPAVELTEFSEVTTIAQEDLRVQTKVRERRIALKRCTPLKYRVLKFGWRAFIRPFLKHKKF